MSNIYNLCKKTTVTNGLILALLICISSQANQDKNPVVESENMVPNQAETTVEIKMNPNEQVTFSKQDLAIRLGLEADAIKVSGATTVTCRSGAMGCPKPGMSYTDVLVPGVWIILRVDTAIYRYHAIPNGQPFYCPEEWAEGPVVGPGAD